MKLMTAAELEKQPLPVLNSMFFRAHRQAMESAQATLKRDAALGTLQNITREWERRKRAARPPRP